MGVETAGMGLGPAMSILATGGAGYIDSHTCLALLEAGHEVTVLDNLCNGSPVALERVQELTGRPLRFIQGDIRNPEDLARAFAEPVQAVVHFAALKAVGESCCDPLANFDNNIGGTIALLRAMGEAWVRTLCANTWRWQRDNPRGYPCVGMA